MMYLNGYPAVFDGIAPEIFKLVPDIWLSFPERCIKPRTNGGLPYGEMIQRSKWKGRNSGSRKGFPSSV